MKDDDVGLQAGTPQYRRLLVALFFIGVATFAQLYSPQGLLPLISTDQQISPDRAALMISAATLGVALGVIPWSYVGDAVGRKQAMLGAITLACICAALITVAPGFASMLALRFVEGLMLGGVPALAVAYLSEEVSPKIAAIAAGTYVSGTTIGGLAGRIIAAPIGGAVGWELGMLSVTGLAVLCVLIFLRSAPRAQNFTPRVTRLGEAMAALVGNLRSPTLCVIYLQGCLTMGGFVAVYNFLGFRLAGPPFSLPLWLVSFLFLAYLAGTYSAPRAGAMASRFGRKPVLIAGNLTMVAGTALTLVADLWAIITGTVILTVGFFAAHAVASGWAGSSAVAGRSQSSSLYNLGYYGGSSLFGFAGGIFLDQAGWPGTVAMVLGLTAVATLLAVVILPRD